MDSLQPTTHNNLSHLLNSEALSRAMGHSMGKLQTPPASRPVSHNIAGNHAVGSHESWFSSAIVSTQLKARLDQMPPSQSAGEFLQKNAQNPQNNEAPQGHFQFIDTAETVLEQVESSAASFQTHFENIPLPSPEIFQKPFRFQNLCELFFVIRRDVFHTRDRLLTLNTSRRALIERRLEFIARKIARSRGERMNRSLSLPEILRDSFRTQTREKTLGHLALEAFASEVALHCIFQLFFLKALDRSGWRPFLAGDLNRLNFAAHSFLLQKAMAFANDRHSFNFVRPNVYSWYNLTNNTLSECTRLLEAFDSEYSGSWSGDDLNQWLYQKREDWGLDHLDFGKDTELARSVWNFVEHDLGIPLVTQFQGHRIAKKVFMPTLESGGLALGALDSILNQMEADHAGSDHSYRSHSDPTEACLHQSLWATENEGLETFYTEVMVLLKMVHVLKNRNPALQNTSSLFRLPHGLRVSQLLGLELHTQEQLTLAGSSSEALVQNSGHAYQGTASSIQQFENFDISVVLDHPDRNRSARWLKALAEQLPYWRSLVTSSTNLNWGELHLQLALSKLKDHGHCIYLSHRVMPDNGDGERFRRALLGMATLDYLFVDLPEDIFGTYRYMYVFTKEANKTRRDQSRVRFGKWDSHASTQAHLEESSSTQWEVAERGWDQVFVRGAAPLVRHLGHKFPKLFQVATVQQWAPEKSISDKANHTGLFGKNRPSALEIRRDGQKLMFKPMSGEEPQERLVVFPHNAADLSWLTSVLNSSPVQFWIRMQVTQESGPVKFQDLRSIPVLDFSTIPQSSIQDCLNWLGKNKPAEQALMSWALECSEAERSPRFVALAKRRFQLDVTLQKYRPLFDSIDLEKAELNPETVSQFYPTSLLCSLMQTPDVKVQYLGKELSSTNTSNWILRESNLQNQGQKALITIQTKQGPQIQLLAPHGMSSYLQGQLRRLRDFTWGEAVSLLKAPRDVSLFTAQTSEITRMVLQIAFELQNADRALEAMALDLFEIAAEDRQYLKS